MPHGLPARPPDPADRRPCPRRPPAAPRAAPFELHEGELRHVVKEEQEAQIFSLFPNLTTQGLHMYRLEPAASPAPDANKPLRLAVVLSGGQAAGAASRRERARAWLFAHCSCFALLLLPGEPSASWARQQWQRGPPWRIGRPAASVPWRAAAPGCCKQLAAAASLPLPPAAPSEATRRAGVRGPAQRGEHAASRGDAGRKQGQRRVMSAARSLPALARQAATM